MKIIKFFLRITVCQSIFSLVLFIVWVTAGNLCTRDLYTGRR